MDRTNGEAIGMTLEDLLAPLPVNDTVCGWWVGPIWKLEGETCVCIKPEHLPDDPTHECSCGTWFQKCGHPPEVVSHETP